MSFYKKRIVRLDTPADIEERIRHRNALDQVNAEIKARWPKITADNFHEVWVWKQARIAELGGTSA